MNWNDQVAVITGAASGLGFALAQRLAGHGVRVAMFDVQPDRLRAAAEHIEGAVPVAVDVTDETAVRDAVASVRERLGRIDILVNCAGITGVTNRRSHEVDLADFER